MAKLLTALWVASFGLSPLAFAAETRPVLARVELRGDLAQVPLPVHAVLSDAAGQQYALVIASRRQLERAGWPYRVLDPAAAVDAYLLARPMRADARQNAEGKFHVVHDDGAQWIVRVRRHEDATALGDAGFAVARLSRRPLAWKARPKAGLKPWVKAKEMTAQGAFTSSAWVAAMMSGVTSNYLVWLMSQITGEEPAPASGELRVISTRHTNAKPTLNRARDFCYEFFAALGLNPQRQSWNLAGYSDFNIVATQPGAVTPDEQVLIVAHLDDMPSSGRAPGADDNASGSCAVLAAAAMLSQYQFARTIRYVLFTGEEQGLLGSSAYAEAAADAGEDIQAVLNLDMIAWDSKNGPSLLLYTRSTGDPGYEEDLAIATTFTNVVATYGLVARLQPILVADSGMVYSDHASFWNHGYPAILGIEHYGSDFNPYYHSSSDSLAHINTNYFTAFTQAAVGTIAHLAEPVATRSYDVVRVVSGDWSATNRSFGASVLHAVHVAGAQETNDAFDVPYASLPANTNQAWPILVTQPGGDDLHTDCRDTASESIFRGDLILASPYGGSVSFTNRLRFTFLTPPATDRVYVARITVSGAFTQSGTDFVCVTNLRHAVAGTGFVELPALVNVTNGALYGTCDVAARFLACDPAQMRLQIASVTATQVVLEANVQVATRTHDEVTACTNLVPAGTWTLLGVFTNQAPPSAANFEAGWERVTLPLDVSAWGEPVRMFFRLRRNWLEP